MEWDPEPFFRVNGVYYDGFNDINPLLLRDGYISIKTLNELPEVLPQTGIEIFDKRRDRSWKNELEEYIAKKRETKYEK